MAEISDVIQRMAAERLALVESISAKLSEVSDGPWSRCPARAFEGCSQEVLRQVWRYMQLAKIEKLPGH